MKSLLQLKYTQMKNSNPQQIRAKFHQMGVLLLLDSPEHLQFGIDNITWQVGTKFKGIKLIPLGTHIITYSLKNQNHMFPIKKFIYFGSIHKEVNDQERIRVFRWSSKSQKFIIIKGQQAQGYRQGVKKYHFDSYLGPYPDQNVQFWATNTKYITKQVLDKLDPIQSFQKIQQQYTGSKIQEKQEEVLESESEGEGFEQQIGQDTVSKQLENLELEQEEQRNDNKKGQYNIKQIKKNKDFGDNIYYSEIPRKLTQSLTHTTLINIDRTEVLEAILKSEWPNNQNGILGQLQYSFIAFLIGQCLDSYNQWKKLMVLFCSSESAFNSHKNLMLQFIVVFYEQLRQFPEDFFYDELAKENFLNFCLKNLRIFHTERNISKKALSRIEKLLLFIEHKFRFQVTEEQQENPIIVMQNESYF